MYIVVFKYAVSAILFRHVLSNGQKLVYYVSKALVNVETRYPQVEQTVLVLHIAMKKFRPYFEAHQVTILTNQPLRVTLHKLYLSGWIMKWAIELSEYDI